MIGLRDFHWFRAPAVPENLVSGADHVHQVGKPRTLSMKSYSTEKIPSETFIHQVQ